ncbi:TetR/AcrR family transcriptional regulator [Paenibacillus xylanilyticus]|uniref:TetR/AcrR family transcriptional regulator n=1 Tax=Paenibacillus xylanilyticus TaxID=248903 RepID=A0A7Y6C2Q3_9BACL|nr:TetR/AcrR family transcriptional regulator [Paenibacillus xylanilyticus]NUU79532.1 TetR/AcrR family transcriptional regulator [Paenibacillus xylanilyticus]
MSGVFSPNPNDPRVIRTRQLIVNAFLMHLNKKDFYSITIRDITEKATINRATFYAHFADKYELLESVLSFAFEQYVLNKVNAQAPLTEVTVKQLITSLCNYHDSSNQCIKKYESVAPIFEENIKTQLEQLILQIITRETDQAERKTLANAATMLSWSIYGLTYRWNLEGRQESPAELAERVAPLIMGGAGLLN